jgi:broad specificity phosphatase PhoE
VRRAILARHAESALNASSVLNGVVATAGALTPRGRDQARALGDGAGPVDVVLHSEFARAEETARLAWPDAPRVVVAELNEISFGAFEGSRFDDGYGEWCRTTGPLDPCPGGGESRVEAIRRYLRGYRRVLERPEETVGVVAHGAHLAYVLLALSGTPPIPELPVIPPAVAFVAGRDRLDEAVEVIEAWAREPAWR